MTVNQALDKLLTKYSNDKAKSLPDVFALKLNLVDLKVFSGGNTLVENLEYVEHIIKTGKTPK